MDVQTKHRVELLNAKCDLVNKLYEYCKKSEYGEDDSCLKGLYAKSKLIDRLDCYGFPVASVSTTTNGTFTISAANTGFTYLPGTYLLKNGNSIIATHTITVNTTPKGVIEALIIASGLVYSVVVGEVSSIYTVTINCSHTPFTIYILDTLKDTFLLGLAPVCKTNYTKTYNCLKDSDLPKMYEVLKKLGK